MDTSFLFQDCYTGTDFENKIVEFLSKYGFMAQKTGSNDGGIDTFNVLSPSLDRMNECSNASAGVILFDGLYSNDLLNKSYNALLYPSSVGSTVLL